MSKKCSASILDHCDDENVAAFLSGDKKKSRGVCATVSNTEDLWVLSKMVRDCGGSAPSASAIVARPTRKSRMS